MARLVTAAVAAVWVSTSGVAGSDAPIASVYAVEFLGDSPSSIAACAANAPGSAAVVTALPDTAGDCVPLEGAPAATPFYSLQVDERGDLVAVRFRCEDGNCSSCLAEATSTNGCDVMRAVSRAVSFRAGDPPNLLPLTSRNATADASLVHYASCGDPAAVVEIDAVSLGNGTAHCTPVASSMGVAYQSLHSVGNDALVISGGWLCDDADCAQDSCAVVFNRHYVGTSLAAGQTGCFRVEPTAKLNASAGSQPPCSCSVNHVYVATYSVSAKPEPACSLGQRFHQVEISRLELGPTAYHPMADPNATEYRYLDVQWDEEEHSSVVAKLGIDCEADSPQRCSFLRQNLQFNFCYAAIALRTSLTVFPPSDVCYGSSNLNTAGGGIAVYWFTGDNCPANLDADPTAALTIRGYSPPNGRCMYDGDASSPLGAYILNKTSSPTGVQYTGGFGCNANCSDCEIEVEGWREGQCHETAVGAMQIFPVTQLRRCRGGAPNTAPTPPPPGPPGPVGPQTDGISNPAVFIGAVSTVVAVVIAVIGFIFYVRSRKHRREYEDLGGTRRQQRRREREDKLREKQRQRNTERADSSDVAQALFYDGI
mmetsp:Transcript_16129/g.41810  ORF Transcript_16129/g.41810 Transcript_16129/m.41810 type:complete len:596 (+) Transcript_16129:20-1807(+)